MTDRYEPKGRPVADIERWWAHDLVLRVGPVEAARVIGISRSTLATVLAGLPVYPATEHKVRRARLDA